MITICRPKYPPKGSESWVGSKVGVGLYKLVPGWYRVGASMISNIMAAYHVLQIYLNMILVITRPAVDSEELDVGWLMLVLLPSLVWDWRTVTFQLSGSYCRKQRR